MSTNVTSWPAFRKPSPVAAPTTPEPMMKILVFTEIFPLLTIDPRAGKVHPGSGTVDRHRTGYCGTVGRRRPPRSDRPLVIDDRECGRARATQSAADARAHQCRSKPILGAAGASSREVVRCCAPAGRLPSPGVDI